jgi:mitogen-activated protein kinase kinase kinase
VSKFISPTYGFCTTNIDDTEAIADVAGDRDASYLLVVSVEQDDNIEWDGPCIAADLFADDWGIPTGSARLVTDLTRTPLGASKRAFSSVVEAGVVSPHTLPPHTAPIVSPSPRQIHALSPAIQTTVTRILDTISNLAEFVAGSTERMRDWAGDRGLHVGRETLLTCWYQSLASFTDFRKGMTQDLLRRFDESMAVISSSWLTFISTKQSRTNFVLSPFRAAHGALAFSAACLTVSTWRQHYPDQWQVLQSAMATCVIHLNSINLAARSRPVQSMSQEVLSAAHIIKDIRAAIAKAGEFTSGGIELEPVATRREASQQRTEMAIHYLDEQINLRHQRGRLVNVEPDNAPLISLASRGVFIPRQQGRLLGSGAYGSVYLAQVLDSDVLIAVKEVKLPGIVDQTRIYARIKVELSVLQELRHCNIVEYYGFEVHNHKICIFEEYCSGGSLKQRLTVGRIRDETVIQKYTRDLLAGLSYLHSRGVVHHDIKPDSEFRFYHLGNHVLMCGTPDILFDGEGTIKYVDFGASQILADRQRTMELARSAMDDTPSDSASTIRAESFRSDSTLRGTPMYMSPEVVSGGSASGRSAVDIWSLGCVVLEMSTGRKPWEHLPNDW